MITFYPGPSKVYSQVSTYVAEAQHQGLLSVNHRSPEFMTIYENTVRLVKEKLAVPPEYSVLFASSSTECWEIIGQSLVRNSSFHLFNGAFGEKWHRYLGELVNQATAFPFAAESLPEINDLPDIAPAEVLCVTHNETSNGTALPDAWLQGLRVRFPKVIIAADATSSMAGVHLPWLTADVWYASVQKCFGLPAGLAVLIVSPRAIERIKSLAEKKHYNSLLSIYEHSLNHQTTHTPNILNIYLLMRTLEARPAITQVDQELRYRYQQWMEVVHELSYVKALISNELVRSHSVIALAAQPPIISRIKAEARQQGITLGNGYGKLKDTTVRIANFPAITPQEIDQLVRFLRQFSPSTSS